MTVTPLLPSSSGTSSIPAVCSCGTSNSLNGPCENSVVTQQTTTDGLPGDQLREDEPRVEGHWVHELGRLHGPVLVLLHGLSDSALCWPDAVRRWNHDYRIVAPDARGHGQSARFDLATSGSNRFADMVADLVALLEALAEQGIGAPVLVGHSMGAGVAAAVLASRPDLVSAGVLEDPPWFSGSRGDAP